MVACGDPQETIARAIGISVETLQKHFPEELATGYARKRKQVVDMLFAGAARGNATLIKRVEEMTRTAGAAADFSRAEQPAKPAKAPKLGKKEVAQKAADDVAAGGSDWGDDLAPGSTAIN